MNLNLKNKRALVCGASQGIGAACAQELAVLGCEVLLLARSEEKLQKILSTLATDQGQKHSYVVADMNHLTELSDRVNQKFKEFGQIHILVNNSGGPPAGAISEAKIADFNSAFGQHLFVNTTLVQLALPYMKEQKYGRIINVLSTSVKAPLPDLGVSNTTRWAVASWAKTLSQEVASFGVTVNNVLPGATRTERLAKLVEAKAQKHALTPAEEEKAWLSAIPARRFAEPEEIASMVAFLASPAAGYVNGVAIPVDGGRTPCL